MNYPLGLFLLAVSTALNAFLLIKLRKNSTKQESYELKDFMHDLLAGEGLVRVSRVSPADVLLRSPNR